MQEATQVQEQRQAGTTREYASASGAKYVQTLIRNGEGKVTGEKWERAPHKFNIKDAIYISEVTLEELNEEHKKGKSIEDLIKLQRSAIETGFEHQYKIPGGRILFCTTNNEYGKSKKITGINPQL